MREQLEKELFHDVRIEDLPEEMQTLSTLIGLKNVFKLSHYVDGGKIYIPIHDTLLKGARNRKIICEYNGFNCKELAKKWDITEDQLRKIIRDNKKNNVHLGE